MTSADLRGPLLDACREFAVMAIKAQADYAAIRGACIVLYGEEAVTQALNGGAPPPVADAPRKEAAPVSADMPLGSTPASDRAFAKIKPGETVTPSDLAQRLGIGNAFACTLLKILVECDRIEKSGYGKYRRPA